MEWPYHCERSCEPIPTDSGRNVILLSGDRMLAASCDAAHEVGASSVAWSDRRRKRYPSLESS